jgi:flagellar hook-length control protein FliK
MMVFNPVYMQKAGDSESQLFGSSFPNQKPTYLFSDIIKVILAKTEQTEGTENVNVADSSVNNNPLLISDAEVELFDKLMKLGITGSTTGELSDTDSLNGSTVIENLKMFLNGLTDQEESASSEDKKFDVDKSDLLVVLNIFAGNISEQNNSGNSDTDFTTEISDFIEEVNDLLDGMEKNNKQQVVIQQSDFTLELEPSKGGKIAVKIAASTENEVQNPTVEKANVLSNTSKLVPNTQSISNDSVNVDYSYTQKQSSEQPAIFIEANNQVELNDEDKTIISATKTKWEQVLNQSQLVTTENVSENNIVRTDVSDRKIKTIDSKLQINADEDTAVAKTEMKDLSNNTTNNISNTTSSSVVDQKSVDVKEFFGGKIKVEVVDTNNNTVKNTQQQIQTSDSVLKQTSSNMISGQPEVKSNLDAIEFKVKENLVKDNIQSQIWASDSEISTDSEQKTVPVQSSNTALKQVPAESVEKVKNAFPVETTSTENVEVSATDEIAAQGEKTSVVDGQSINRDAITDNQLPKQEHVKINKQKNQKIETDIQSKTGNSSQTLGTESTSVQNENKQVGVSAVVDGKTLSEKNSAKNQDTEEVVSNISKTAKAVSSNQETSNQKSDKQNQNTFEKTFITVNKTELFSKEIKETVKVVDQSQLMNEIENVIKSGDKKLITLNIYPEELGSVKISLDFTDNNVTAKINVSNDTVRQVILTQADNLKSSLSESGIQLAALNVSVDNSKEKATPQSKTKRKSSSDDKKIVIKDIPNPVKIKNLGYNTYDYIV